MECAKTASDRDERSWTTKGDSFVTRGITLYKYIMISRASCDKVIASAGISDPRSIWDPFGSHRLTREANGKDIIYI